MIQNISNIRTNTNFGKKFIVPEEISADVIKAVKASPEVNAPNAHWASATLINSKKKVISTGEKDSRRLNEDRIWASHNLRDNPDVPRGRDYRDMMNVIDKTLAQGGELITDTKIAVEKIISAIRNNE